jgi:hypothetical protein
VEPTCIHWRTETLYDVELGITYPGLRRRISLIVRVESRLEKCPDRFALLTTSLTDFTRVVNVLRGGEVENLETRVGFLFVSRGGVRGNCGCIIQESKRDVDSQRSVKGFGCAWSGACLGNGMWQERDGWKGRCRADSYPVEGWLSLLGLASGRWK